MFVPVACSQCGKPFQVPEEAVGKPAACPWCQAAVLALPVGDVAPKLEPEPLPLDDEPPPAATPPPRRLFGLFRTTFGSIALVTLVLITVGTITVVILRYKQGYFTSLESWRTFTAPDGSCAIQLLGSPVEDSAAPQRGERRYSAEGWYSGTTTWIGWRNLTTAETQVAATAEAWHDPQLMKLFDAERDQLKDRLGGYIAKDATIKFKDPLTREVRFEMPTGRAIERMIVRPTGPRPRIYFIGIAGKRLDLEEGGEVKLLFDSFRVIE